MEAGVLVDELVATSLIPDVNMSGLELLTEALLDATPTPAGTDAIVTLPPALPQPLPPETESHPSVEEDKPQNEGDTTEGAAGEPVRDLLPPFQLNESATKGVDGVNGDSVSANADINPVGRASEDSSQNSTGEDIAAYFALEFLDMQYIYYLQRSSVSLGRSSNDPNVVGADIDLGPLKNISRLHARIEYEEELERFVLAVIGRNGAYVNGVWNEPGKRAPLGDRTLIQISTRAFYFILPHSLVPTSASPEQVDGEEVPPLDSTITTAEDEDSHSTGTSTTPKQRIILARRRDSMRVSYNNDDEEDISYEFDRAELLHPEAGKGKGKGKEAFAPARRPRGRPRKNSTPAPAAVPRPVKEEAEDVEIPDVDPLDLSESEEESVDEDDRDGDFVPRKTKKGVKKRGGLGKTRSTGSARTLAPPKPSAPRQSKTVQLDEDDEDQDEIMSEASIVEDEVEEDGLMEEVEEGEEGESPQDATVENSTRRSSFKRKRESAEDSAEDNRPEKRRRSFTAATSGRPGRKPKAATKSAKDGPAQKARKKTATKPEMKSLFTTIPAPALSAVVAAAAAASANAEGAGDGETGGKSGAKKGKGVAKKGKKPNAGDDLDGAEDVKPEEEAKPAGPPPPKPPFTYPLLCYRALKALNGKAPYRAITKWLETEYPYFAAATKEGKDGWENSTRHTLSSHRAFLKIDRKPEERGKGCFWSFDPEFEEQFKDQWRAAESQARNPRPAGRPPNPTPPHAPNGLHHPPPPGMMFPRPPPGFGQPGPSWAGITPPHLMPGYRPMPPGAGPPNGAPFPYPPPGMMPRLPGHGPPLHPHPHGHPPHPLGMPPPPLPGGAPGIGKARAPKKPKQALGAAFSRAPLIRPGLGGVPGGTGKSEEGNAEAQRRGDHAIRMAIRAVKDELAGRVPKGTAVVAATGGWGFPPPPPPGSGKNGAPLPGPNRPPADSKVSIKLCTPPAEALPPAQPFPPRGPSPSGKAKTEDSATEDDGSKSPEVPTVTPSTSSTSSVPRIMLPMTFFNDTFFLDPKAFPFLGEADVSKMTDMNFGDALQHVLSRLEVSRAAAVPKVATPEDTEEAPEEAADGVKTEE